MSAGKPTMRAGGFLGLMAVSVGVVAAKAQLGQERPRLGVAANAIPRVSESPRPRATITIYPSPGTVRRTVAPSAGQQAPDTSTGVAVRPAPVAQGPRVLSGDSVNTEFGPVQVQILVAKARITDAKAIEYPRDDPESIEINDQCLPTLRAQVLKAQSSDIQGVSGCTVTGQAYALSVQSALDRA